MNMRVVQIIAEAIRKLGRIPSGHLYAQVMGALTLDQYQGVIGTLERSGVIEVKNHELIWKGGNVS